MSDAALAHATREIDKLRAERDVYREALEIIDSHRNKTLLGCPDDAKEVQDAYSTGAHNAFCDLSERASLALSRGAEILKSGDANHSEIPNSSKGSRG